MCGRFNVIDNPGLRQLLRDLGVDLRLPTGINLAPTEDIPLVRRDADGASLAAAHWWLVPSWAEEVSQKYSMFNARSETLGKSPAFRHPFKSQRGLVPMSSFIEWRPEGGVKQPWLVTNEQQALAVAALWDIWEGGEQPLLSCTLVTTDAPPQFEPWHARMPLLLAPDECGRWLDNTREIPPDDPLFRRELKMPLRLQPLARAVGNSRNKHVDVLQATGEVIELHT
jgi:putative SOS response-associated peptidase YedK